MESRAGARAGAALQSRRTSLLQQKQQPERAWHRGSLVTRVKHGAARRRRARPPRRRRTRIQVPRARTHGVHMQDAGGRELAGAPQRVRRHPARRSLRRGGLRSAHSPRKPVQMRSVGDNPACPPQSGQCNILSGVRLGIGAQCRKPGTGRRLRIECNLSEDS